MQGERDGHTLQAQSVSLDLFPVVAPEASADLASVRTLPVGWLKLTDARAELSRCAFSEDFVEETAEVLRVSPETVARDWRLAKAWFCAKSSGERNES
jgi:hypothetical protein